MRPRVGSDGACRGWSEDHTGVVRWLIGGEECITGDCKTSRESRKQTGVKYAQFSLGAFDAAALVLTNANSYVWNTLRTFRHQARQVARRCYPTASSLDRQGARGRSRQRGERRSRGLTLVTVSADGGLRESVGQMNEGRRIPETLEEAYRLRDSAEVSEEWEFHQEQVYRLRGKEYRQRGIRTEVSTVRREHQRAIEFSREVFFLEVDEIPSRHTSADNMSAAREEARLYASRLQNHALLEQNNSPHSGDVELYRRNYLDLLRLGESPREAYYLSRIIGPVQEEQFRRALENLRQTGYPKGRMAYTAQRAAIPLRDFPSGMVLVALTFFALLFTFFRAISEWTSGASAATILIVILDLLVAGVLILSPAILIAAFVRSKTVGERRGTGPPGCRRGGGEKEMTV